MIGYFPNKLALAVLSCSRLTKTHMKSSQEMGAEGGLAVLREHEVTAGPALPETLTLCKQKAGMRLTC